jgi:hypothetical protein
LPQFANVASNFTVKKYAKKMFPVWSAGCQEAEISAAKHKRGRNKLCGAGKILGRTFAGLSKKGQKGPNFFVVWFCTTVKQSYFWQKIVTSH